MKRIATIITALVFMTNITMAQSNTEPKNSVKFGIGNALTKPYNFYAKNVMHIQYEHTLFKPVRIFADGFRLNANKVEDDGNERSIMAYQVDGGINLALFSNESNAFKIGGGGSWQSANNEFTTSIERDSNNNIVNKTFDKESVQQYGWMASMEYEVYIVTHIVMGARLTYKRYENGEENYFFGLNAGFRF